MFQQESLLIPDSTVGVNVPSMQSAWSHRLSEHCSIFQPCPSLIRTLGPPAHPPRQYLPDPPSLCWPPATPGSTDRTRPEVQGRNPR